MLHQEFLNIILINLSQYPKQIRSFFVKKLSCVVKFLDLTKRAQSFYVSY